MQQEEQFMKYAMAFLLLAVLMMPLYADLFISEYIEGGSNNKALEIYNPGGVGVDLSHYAFGLAANGAASWSVNPLSGTIAPNDVWINCNAGSSTAIQAVADSIGGTSTYYNGDDAVCLMYSADLTTWNAIDIIGVLGVDPGTGWDVAGTTLGTLNHTLVRKPGITAGTTNWAASAGTTAEDSQWIVYDVDVISYLGWHNASGGNQPPAIGSVTVTRNIPPPPTSCRLAPA
jgi:predicted extracellular nuclease